MALVVPTRLSAVAVDGDVLHVAIEEEPVRRKMQHTLAGSDGFECSL
jgi:hypothetical protein